MVAKIGALAAVRAFRRDPLDLYARVGREPGGMARVSVLGRQLLVITHPEHADHVLRVNHQNYDKNAVFYNNARPFLGNGLPVTHGGEDWLRRRRLMQPAFQRKHLHVVTDVTEQCTADTLAGFARAAESGEPVDVSLEMTRLTMRIMCRTLFAADVRGESGELATRFERISRFAVEYLTMPFPPLFVPTRGNRAFQADVRFVQRFVADLVAARRADPERHDDLLDLLIHAGEELSPRQLQDELISMFFAGHDTTAHTLAWAWYLLAGNEEAAALLRAELGSVLGGRQATVADLPALTYTRLVLEETMRLFPALWAMMRRAIGEDTIGGQRIAPNTLVTWSPYVGNRHPDFWAEPDAFRPERHAHESSRHAVVPFGAGPRACMGRDFALAKATLILATLAQHHRQELVREVKPGTGITLHPEGGVWVRLS